MPSSLGIVIVNYRTPALAIECLRSLAPEVARAPGTRVVVVDGGSADGSAERLAGAIATEEWTPWVTLLCVTENRGFSAGNNAGLAVLLADPSPPALLLLLNPDTIVRPGALEALVAFADANPAAGIVGSRLEHRDGTRQDSAFRFHSLLSQLDDSLRLGIVSRVLAPWRLVLPPSDVACRAGWVSGASLLVRREVLDRIGLLDDGYFLYYEEVDLCLRAARAGWECWYEPRSRVVHLVGQSTGVDPSSAERPLPKWVLESRRRYFVKNHGVAYAAAADLLWILGHLAWRVRMVLQRRPARVAPRLLRDFLRQSVLLGARTR